MPKAKDKKENKKEAISGFVYFIDITKHLRSMMTTAITIIIITALSTDTIAV